MFLKGDEGFKPGLVPSAVPGNSLDSRRTVGARGRTGPLSAGPVQSFWKI